MPANNEQWFEPDTPPPAGEPCEPSIRDYPTAYESVPTMTTDNTGGPSPPPPPGDMVWVPRGLLPERCPDCKLNWSLNPPANFDDPVVLPNGTSKYHKTNGHRCVECKTEYRTPLPTQEVSEAMVERALDTYWTAAGVYAPGELTPENHIWPDKDKAAMRAAIESTLRTP